MSPQINVFTDGQLEIATCC